MILKRTCLRLQLTTEATPQTPGVSGPVALGMRHVEFFSAAANDPEGLALWGVDIAGITGGATPVVNFVSGVVTADGTTVTGNTDDDFEGGPMAITNLKVIIITVTGALVTATVSGTGLLARLPVGTHVLSGERLLEWEADVTFAAPSGTAAIKFAAFGTTY